MLSVTTDFATDKGDPSPFLRYIAEAGFSHVHWCHHFDDDFAYFSAEVEQIRTWLSEYGLQVLDLHASSGVEKQWFASEEYRRKAGVDLVKNRIEMVARLDASVIVMHAGGPNPRDQGLYWTQIRRSLDEIEPFARERSVRIAIENGTWSVLGPLLAAYPPDYVGLCYDSGHANMEPDGMGEMERLKDRLIAVHLHDNTGRGDLHNPIFSGTVNWARLARILATSAYRGPVQMEITLENSGFSDAAAFLAHARETGERFAEMIDEAQGK